MNKWTMLLLSILLMGCSGRLREGTVVEKTIVPAHTYHQWYTTGKIHTFRTIHYPESYRVKIEGFVEGERTQEEYSFEQSFYDSIKVGDVLVKVDDGWRKQ